MVELIITEKPSSAQKVATALADGKAIKKKLKKGFYYELSHKGKDIYVTSAVGHLYGLVEAHQGEGAKKWDYPTFDITWQASYKSSEALAYVKDYVKTIEELSKKATEFTIACDYDVEGEVIGLNVIRFACKQQDANRMKFSTLTKGDLIESYNTKLKHLDWGQAHAGETRHKLDWFYGINLSRALTASVKAAGSFKIMSAGRVQGPALKLLVDREKEIQAFVPEPFWQIKLDGTVTKDPNSSLEAWHSDDKIFDKQHAEKIMKTVSLAKTATVSSIERSERKQASPNPFNLTNLQSESYGLFKITPKDTLAIAQSLYVAGFTSYPRTSSQQLDPKLGFRTILASLSKQKEYKDLATELLAYKELKPNNGKKTDPAHPAIYPTGEIPKNLKAREQKIYDLIVKRFMATFAPPAVRETMSINLDVNAEEFRAKGTRTLAENWHRFYKPYVRLEEVSLPNMSKGDSVTINSIEKLDKETQPPNRYNQSSIIKELEKRNLGTKATRADILYRLFERGYVEGVKITVSQFGIETVKILEKHAPIIVDEKLTVQFEDSMEKIREGKEKQETVLENAKARLEKVLKDFKSREKEIGKEIIESLHDTWDAANYMGPCPVCSKDESKKGRLMIKRGKFGRFVACSNYPECTATFKIPRTGKVKYLAKQCEECDHPLVEVGEGRRQQKMCLNVDCKSRLEEGVTVEGKVTATGKKYPEEDMACPTCKEGKMILRKSFYGEFLGCNNYPKCKTMMRIKEGKVDVANPIVKTGDSSKKKKTSKSKKTKSKKTKTVKRKTTKRKTVKKKVATSKATK